MLKVQLKKYVRNSIYLDVRRAVFVSQTLLRSLWIPFGKRNRLRKVRGNHLLLHLGCGEITHNGWINVDIDTPLGYVADFRDPIPLADGCAQHIHCEHALEHLEYEEAVSFLRECYRLLATGGSLRLILPDAEKYLRAYCEDVEFFKLLRHLGGAVRPLETRMEIINQMFRMGGAHRFAWDFETLEYNLEHIRRRYISNDPCE